MIRFFIVTALLSFCLPSCHAGDPCPTKEELGACTCHYVDISKSNSSVSITSTFHRSDKKPRPPNTTVTTLARFIREVHQGSMFTEIMCKGARTITALEETVRFALHRKMVDKLIVSNVPAIKEHVLVNLPNKWLKNSRIRQFEIHDTLLSGDFLWQGNPFEGQEDTLMWLSAYRCSLYGALTYDDLGTVHTRGLNLLPRLEGVDFSLNQLTVIKATAFRTPPTNLSNIVLSRNSLKIIESGSFQHVTFLKNIDLSNNLLESVVRTLFAAPARFLECIDLSWNFLRVLPVNFFVNMPSLKIVNLSKNFLHSMPKEPWAVVWKQLTFLDITGNFINCDCDLLWLLPILSPAEKNATTTPAPKPLSGQDIRGSCSQNSQMPGRYFREHKLTNLKRNKLMCS
ncbi:uncharacterized protein CDAR_224191 [Caerostris darwini]|uniref:Uncharacterized protein n=1 Tax=Caerostris darwini TaxID=1538125 RepID=A0AAV4WNK2_9ARAC|nr:uncharacterized protein CDAR_224191 [Caerostris darwini]